MPDSPLYFIQPHVLERLRSGQFVAQRQKNKPYALSERRNLLSPLNVTRRAVRYEYQVFLNRRDTILEAVDTLNNPVYKLLMVSGPSGRGKTSFVRAVAEMMGGGQEQLLWFEVSRHTDHDEVIRFLVDAMTYTCRLDERVENDETSSNPVATLDGLLRQVPDYPILVVIDNIEHLVAPDNSLRSRELKDALNFLLSFPNVKLVLSGKQLPVADMNPTLSVVHHIALAPLGLDEAQAVIETQAPDFASLQAETRQSLLTALAGEPLNLSVFSRLWKRSGNPARWLDKLSSGEPIESLLWQFWQETLSPEDVTTLGVLSLLRHGAPPASLAVFVQACEPTLNAVDWKQIDQSRIRPLLKKVFPPQLVLARLRARLQQEDSTRRIEAYYQVPENYADWISRSLPLDKVTYYHERLSVVYRGEKNKHMLERLYFARTAHLAGEAQYHLSRAKRRRPAGMLSETPSEASDRRPLLGVPTSSDELRHDMATGFLPAYENSGYIDNSPTFALQQGEVRAEAINLTLSDSDLKTLARFLREPEPTGRSSEPAEHQSTNDLPSPSSAHFSDAKAVAALSEAMASRDTSRVAEELLALGHVRFQNGHLENAITCWKEALSRLPEHASLTLSADLHQALGMGAFHQFKHNDASRYWRHVLYLNEHDPLSQISPVTLAKTHQGLAEIALYRGQYDTAIKAYEQALQLQALPHKALPEETQASLRFQLALCWDESGDNPQAITHYQLASRYSREHGINTVAADSLFNLASVYVDQQDYAKATEALQESIALDRAQHRHFEAVKGQLFLGQIAHKQGRFADERAAYELAVDWAEAAFDKPLWVECLLRLAGCLEQQHLSHEALGAYEQARMLGAGFLSQDVRETIAEKLSHLRSKTS